jgi:hypothetical protein
MDTRTASTPAAQPRFRRRRFLIKPRLQLRLSLIFVGLTLLALTLQGLLFGAMVVRTAEAMPVGGEYLMDLLPGMMLRSILFALGVAVPLTVMAGIRSTFPITGPVHRFESYLREVLAGTQLGPCKIRKGDHLGELCELINRVTEPVRRREVASPGEERAAEDQAA